MKNAIFKVHGMHCDGCAQIIQSVLERHDGVLTCAVSFEDSRAHVMFDPARVDESQLQAAIEKAGYQVEPRRDVPDTAARRSRSPCCRSASVCSASSSPVQWGRT